LLCVERPEMCFKLWQCVDDDKIGVCVGLEDRESSKVVVCIVRVKVLEIVMKAGDKFPPEPRKDD
jgi:hypothetical protein